jgi:glycosyltransferase involved in cell wall biosynthesis
MSEKLFEVFLGTYNAEPWIAKTLQALEKQTFTPFKITIIDNASTDETISIIEDLFQNFNFKNEYRLIKNQINIGPISTFMDRLDLFDAEWIFMIHQDDFYHENHVQVLVEAIENSKPETGIVFSGVIRMDENGNELPIVPTIASKLSEVNRVANIQLAIQMTPTNFPTCALKKSVLSKVNTTRHTSAFNDAEILFRMMCISDVKYMPIETAHYRIHENNAHAITKSDSNDYAIFIGLIEFFHSKEFEILILGNADSINFDDLVSAITHGIEYRISDKKYQILLKGIVGELLIRLIGYEKSIANFLIDVHTELNLSREASQIKNLVSLNKFEILTSTTSNYGKASLDAIEMHQFFPSRNLATVILKKIKLRNREKFINSIFTSPIGKLFKRPFVQVWNRQGNKE